MSSFLYTLGHRAFRMRRVVLAAWLAALILVGAAAAVLGKGTENSFTIPGTEAQQALDQLTRSFPEVSGSSAQIVVAAPAGQTVTEAAIEEPIRALARSSRDLEGAVAVMNPFSARGESSISADGSAAIVTVQFDRSATEVTEQMRAEVTAAADALRAALPAGSTVAVGGTAMAVDLPKVGAAEGLGLVIALVVLVITFSSFLAAGMPLLTALIGVGVTTAVIMAATAFTPISSTTPILSLMLGLAVGIDYTLFIVSRHLDQVRHGMEPEESAARSVATAGSAVVFAGLTVVIALLGLNVTGIPFLGLMGMAAAGGVILAVLVALTLTPALLGFAGPRLTRRLRWLGSHRASADTGARVVAGNRFLHAWITTVTWRPWLTVVVVVGGLLVVALPVRDLALALPDSGSKPPESQARQAYDLISDRFGPGANGPLIVTGSVLQSNDPLGLMADVKREIEALPGVAEVPLATPNRTADTGILQVVPTGAPDSAETKQLVEDLRALRPRLQEQYGFTIAVTGATAVAIDVSSQLSDALLPFGILVVGLCLVLLTMMFRSIWVPVKATAGYLLTVLAAFGVVVAVFEWGWGADLFNVVKTGPLISFMPIVVMGVLFGLAMDYEVFLVARMREEHVHGAEARDAIRRGFLGSGKVVIAAALIMFAVFASFVPEGDASLKPIALALAVGVFIDAFVVRMTLVPAVMHLLGERAWWLPRRLERTLPVFDVEGEAVEREIALASWPDEGARFTIAADDLLVDALPEPLRLRIEPGAVLTVRTEHRGQATAVACCLSGRTAPAAGVLKVAGLLLPERAAAVRRRVSLALLRDDPDPVAAVARAAGEHPVLLVVDGLDRLTDAADLRRVHGLLVAARADDPDLTIVATVLSGADADDAIPAGGTLLALDALEVSR